MTYSRRVKLVQPYSILGSLYPTFFGEAHSLRMVPQTLFWLGDQMRETRYILDVACGTGAAVGAFSALGMDARGVDASMVMLRIARQRMPTLRFGRAQMPVLTLPRSVARPGGFDLVTCYFDSLNTLPSTRALVATLRRVRQLLRPGGYFVADVVLPLVTETLRPGLSPERKIDGWTWQTLSSIRDRGSRLVEEQRLWRTDGEGIEYRETHRFRYWTREELEVSWKRAGLMLTQVSSCVRIAKPVETEWRIALIARRSER